MSKREVFAWAGLAVCVAVIGISIATGNPEAEAEQVERLKREAYAEGYESARDSVEAAHADTIGKLHDALEAEEDTTEAHEERSDVAEASAREVANRLRPRIRAELQSEFDTLLEYHETALAEADSANASLKRQRTLLRAEVEAERSFRIRETERADAWKSAYEAAEVEIEALREKDVNLLGLSFDVDCNVQGGIGTNEPTEPELQVGCGVPIT